MKTVKENNPSSHLSYHNPEEQRIVDQVYKAVLEQRLAPKTKLSEARLCESFGIGRMRVRRALLILASQGIVDLHSNRGAYVACPDPADAQKIFETRIMIEPALSAKIAKNHMESDIELLREHIQLEDDARKSAERADIIRLSGEFHVKLASVSGYSDLTRFVRELVIKTSLIVGLFGGNNEANCPENEHADILTAIEAGDADLVGSLMSHHLNHIQSALDFSRQPDVSTDLSKVLGLK